VPQNLNAMKKSSFLQTHNQVFKILNLIVLILGLSYQTKAQEYKLVVGNKTPCVLMVQSGLCNNAPGLTFYVPPMTQVEQIVTGQKFKKVDVYTVLPNGDELTYTLVAQPNNCGDNFLAPIFLPNACVTNQHFYPMGNGNLHISLWK